MGDLTTEVFHRLTRSGASFTEVTNFTAMINRTRFTIDNNTLTARMRGSVSGVVSQTLEVPEGLFLSSPSIAGQGFITVARNRSISDFQLSRSSGI